MPPIVDVQIPHVRHKTLILWSLGKFQRCCGRYSAICVRIDKKSKLYVSETQTFQISAVWARPNTGFSTLDCKSHEVCNRNKQKWYAKTQVHANFDKRCLLVNRKCDFQTSTLLCWELDLLLTLSEVDGELSVIRRNDLTSSANLRWNEYINTNIFI